MEATKLKRSQKFEQKQWIEKLFVDYRFKSQHRNRVQKSCS